MCAGVNVCAFSKHFSPHNECCKERPYAVEVSTQKSGTHQEMSLSTTSKYCLIDSAAVQPEIIIDHSKHVCK